MLGVIIYLLRSWSQVQRQLTEVQNSVGSRAEERARAAEEESARLRTQIWEMERRLGRIANPGDTMFDEHQRRLRESGGGGDEARP